MKPDNKPIAYDTFQADVKQRKSKVWVKMLADEPVERPDCWLRNERMNPDWNFSQSIWVS